MSTRHWIGLFVAATAAVFLLLLTPGPSPVSAAAAGPVFQMPFECGTSWNASTYDTAEKEFTPGVWTQAWTHHDAFDLTPADGVPAQWVVASADGTVTRADDIGAPTVVIEHADGWSTEYVHMDNPQVSVNDQVSMGDRLGQVGGNEVSGPHLHYTQRSGGTNQILLFDGSDAFTFSAGATTQFTDPRDGIEARLINDRSSTAPLASKNCVQTSLCDGQIVTIDMNTNGGNGQGTAGDDVILGTPGNDVIDAGAGDDTVCAEGGDDNVVGGDGDDTIFGADGADTMSGGQGRDIIRGGPGVDIIKGEGGNDRLLGGIEGDTIDGGIGNDYIGGFGGADTIDGGDGNDRIFGGFGPDTINGGPGADNINGLIGDDTIDGGSGDDTVNGDSGNDTVRGGSGDDVVNGGNASDSVFGDDGDDQLGGGKADDALDGGLGEDVCAGNKHFVADTTVNCETVFGVP